MTVLFAKYHQTYLDSLPTIFHSIAPDKVQQMKELMYNNLTEGNGKYSLSLTVQCCGLKAFDTFYLQVIKQYYITSIKE